MNVKEKNDSVKDDDMNRIVIHVDRLFRHTSEKRIFAGGVVPGSWMEAWTVFAGMRYLRGSA